MAEGEEDRKKGFTVSDRRSFADAVTPASPRASAPAESAPAESAPAASAPAASTTAAASEPGESAPADRGTLPALDFHTFILSLGSSALLHLGELDDPDGAASEPDLPLAKHTIDVIAMLQEKTKGNLSAPEERLIESLLFDLRLKYVEHSKAPRPR